MIASLMSRLRSWALPPGSGRHCYAAAWFGNEESNTAEKITYVAIAVAAILFNVFVIC